MTEAPTVPGPEARPLARTVAGWKVFVTSLGCALLLLAGAVSVRSVSTLREHADEAPSDGRLQQAHEDLIHAVVTGLAGAGLAAGAGLRGYGTARRLAP